MIEVYEILVKSDTNNKHWETKAMFEATPEGEAQAKQLAEELTSQGVDHMLSHNKVKTPQELLDALMELLIESKNTSYLTGVNLIEKIVTPNKVDVHLLKNNKVKVADR